MKWQRIIAGLALIVLGVLALGQYAGIGVQALISSFGGLTNAAPTDMLNGLPMDVQNFDFRAGSGDGGITLVKRRGYEPVGNEPTENYVGGIYVFNQPNEPTQLLAAIGLGLYQYNPANGRWESSNRDSRHGLCYAQNGNDTVHGLATAWWGSSKEAYDTIRINAANYVIRAILLDTVIVLTTNFAEATDSAAACTLVGVGTVTPYDVFSVAAEDKAAIRDGDTLYFFTSEELVKYAGANSSVSATVVAIDSISSWDRKTRTVTLYGGYAKPTDGWVQVQSKGNSDYNIALYEITHSGNSQTFVCDTAIYIWLMEGNGWFLNRFDSNHVTWDTLGKTTITTVFKDSVFADSVLVDSTRETALLYNGAPVDHPTATMCAIFGTRYHRGYSYRYWFRHKIYATGDADLPANWPLDTLNYMTTIAKITDDATAHGLYGEELNLVMGETIDTVGYAVRDTGVTAGYPEIIIGGVFTSGTGYGVEMAADSVYVFLGLTGTGSGKVKTGVYRWNGGTNLALVDTSTERTFTFGTNLTGWYGFDLVNDSTLDSNTQYFVCAWMDDYGVGNTVTLTGQGTNLTTDISGVSITAYGAWPDPLTVTSEDSAKVSIYCAARARYIQASTFGLPASPQTVVHTTAWKTAFSRDGWSMAYWYFVSGLLGVDDHDASYNNYPDSLYGSVSGSGSGYQDTFLVLDTPWCWICDTSNEVACDTVSVSSGFGTLIEEDPPGADSLAMLWPYHHGTVMVPRSLTEDNASEAFEATDSLVILRMARETIVTLASSTSEDTTWDYPIAVSLLDRHWCTGDADDPQLVKVTVDATPGVWVDPITLETDSFYVRDNLGMPNTALATNQNVLFVHKVTGIWSAPIDRSTLDPTGVFPTESRVGALSMRGLVETARGHFFISYPGIFQFDGSSSTLLSGDLARFWRDSVSVENLAGASLVYDEQNDRLMASVPKIGSSVNNVTLVYDFTIGLWTKYTYGMGFPGLVRYTKPTPIVYFGSPDPLTGRVYRLGDVTLDDGEKFEALWRTGWLTLAGLGHEVTVREWYAESQRDTTSDLVFNIYANGSGTPIFADTSTGTSSGWQALRRPMEYVVRGRHVSFEFRSLADTLELSAGQVDYGDEGVMPWKD